MTSLILNRREAAEMCGVCLTTFLKSVKAGLLPQPIRLSTRRVGWRRVELGNFLNGKKAEDSAVNGQN